VALAAGRRGSGRIPAAAAGPVGEGPGRSPSSPRSGWGAGIWAGKPPASGALAACGGGRRELGYSEAEAQLRVGGARAATLGVGGRG
jgi:hypothetical protein